MPYSVWLARALLDKMLSCVSRRAPTMMREHDRAEVKILSTIEVYVRILLVELIMVGYLRETESFHFVHYFLDTTMHSSPV